MRKNSPRKWLHAVLDLLPVILIPVFMIFSHRHDLTSGHPILVDDVVETYKYSTNEVVYNNGSIDTSSLINGNSYLININQSSSSSYIIASNGGVNSGVVSVNDVFNVSGARLRLSWSDDTALNYSVVIQSSPQITHTYDKSYVPCILWSSDYSKVNFSNFNSGQLTLSSIPSSINSIVSVQNNSYVDYQDTSITNVFVDNFNSTIDKYFNMGNVFNLGGVYQWFNTNIFGGNAPQVIYSVWNIALYELVMDLLFLLYGLFMWFIDMVQYLMDKPFKSIK